MIEVIQYERADNAAEIAQALAKLAPKAIELLDEIIDYKAKVQNGGVEMLCGEPDITLQARSSIDLLKIIIPKKHIESRSQFVSEDMLTRIKNNNLQAKAEEASYKDVSSE